MYRIEKYMDSERMPYEGDILELSERKIELFVGEDEVVDGSFRLRSRSGEELHVFFSSNHYRMQCRIGDFIGKEGVFSYRFDATGLDVGSVEKGQITIVSEAGESYVPFTVTVKQRLRETSLGEIRNLFHFANLAKESWSEAVEIFYSDDFRRLFYGHDHCYYDIYRGLSACQGNEYNVDEFLVSIHKKQRNSYHVKEEGLLLKDVTQRRQEALTLVCDGWGYHRVNVRTKGEFLEPVQTVLTNEDFRVNVRTKGEFLEPVQTVLTNEDFRGQECRVLVEVCPEGLFGECNMGCVVFEFGSESLEIPVIVHMPAEISRRQTEKREADMLLVQLMHDYIAVTTAKSKREQYLREAELTVEKMNSGYGRNLDARLFQMHIMILQGEVGEAKWVLAHVEKTQRPEEMSDLQYGYYLYLRSLIEADASFRRSVRERFVRLLEKSPDNAYLTCMYVRLSGDEIPPEKKLELYHEQFLLGSRSPILYRESYAQYEISPVYLTKLGDFEVNVLRFALRYGLYDEQMAERVTEVVARKKEMSPLLFRFLCESYGAYPSDELLQALCTLMIRNGMCGPECFGWYELAVLKQLRITSLYEYYMISADTRVDVLPPRAVLMYFAYHCDLNDRRKAYLFALLLRHRNEIPELFLRYEPAIEEFAHAEISKGIISENLAEIYRYILSDIRCKEIPRQYIQRIAFRHLIKIRRENICKVAVVQNKLEKETVYPVEKNRAYIDCFTDDYAVFLEDDRGNRYCAKEDFTDTKLMSVEKLAMYLEEQAEDSLGFFLYRTHIAGEVQQASMQLWPLYERLALDENVERDYRRRLTVDLLGLYYDMEKYSEMKKLMDGFDVRRASSSERAELIHYLVALEQDEKAFDILFSYGFENVSARVLARLLGRALAEEPMYEVKLMALVSYVFSLGKYTQEMLLYLCRFFDGSMKQMKEVWKAGASFDVDVSVIAERILQTYLFSGGYLAGIDEVFVYYMTHRRRDSVVKGYIHAMTYRYFVNRQLPQPGVFEALGRLLGNGVEMDTVSKIAYLQYMAGEVKEYNENQKQLITELVNEFLFKKGFAPFFGAFVEFIPWLRPYAELSYLEYRTTPGSIVTLHYLQEGQNEQYKQQKLEEYCAGYYCRSFVLFFGRRLQYYFMEGTGKERVLTESGYLEKNDMTGEESESRYGLLNDIVMSETLGDERTQNELTQRYLQLSALTEKLFGE